MLWDDVPDLLRRVQASDDAAWPLLFARSQAFLLARAHRLMGPGWPDQSASDLVQTTWLKVARALPAFTAGATDADTAALFRAWLTVVLKGVYANAVRDAQAVKRRLPAGTVRLDGADDPPADGSTASAPLRRAEEHGRLGAALAGLDAEEHEVVERFYFQGQSLAAIAAELGLTYDQVRERKGRALKKLGDELREEP